MKQKALLICVGAVASALTAFTAQGQSISVKLESVSPALTVKGTFNSGTLTSYSSGQFNFETNSVPTGNFGFEAFCVEPDATISVGQTLTYTVAPNSSLPRADDIARLVGAYLGSSKSNADAAAIQWAIWEVVAETSSSTSLSNGNVKIGNADSTIRDLGNTYLANMGSYDKAEFYYLRNDNHQDVIGFDPNQVVPEPATAGLVALSSILLLRRKRK